MPLSINTSVHDISTLQQLDEVVAMLATSMTHPAWIYLHGDLGAGKTAFCQRFIYHKGYNDPVTSPTYAIMQPYSTKTGMVIHCDLYRLAESEELFDIGLLESTEENKAITLVEWPTKGQGVLPQPTFNIYFNLEKQQRSLTIEKM